jgi:hypothetical protein
MKSRQKALMRAQRASGNEDLVKNAVLSDGEEPIVIQLSSNVSFGLVQVLDHEIRLFREIESIKTSLGVSNLQVSCGSNVIKALRFIDRKRKDGLDKKQLLVFFNSNMIDSQLKMADMTTIFKRLYLKQTGLIHYLDFFNSVYCRVDLISSPKEGAEAVKAQKLKKSFISLVDTVQRDLKM